MLVRPIFGRLCWLEISLKTNAARPKDEITLRQGVQVVKKIGMSEAAGTMWLWLPRRQQSNPASAAQNEFTLRELEPAARAMGMQIQIMNAGTRREIDAAFETIARERHDALLVGSDTSEGAAPRPSPYIKKIERVQMPNALYHCTADRLRPSGCYGSSAGTSGCAGSSP
jgi:hypothetical protein